MTIFRAETAADAVGIRTVHERAFNQPGEANLVDALRVSGCEQVSLVAERGGKVVGHILFTPVSLVPARPPLRGMGLAPLAVLPEFQKQGIGAALVRAGLAACRLRAFDFVVVLGRSDYYAHFGFEPAQLLGWRCEYDVPAEAFMAVHLRRLLKDETPGMVRYRPEFAAL